MKVNEFLKMLDKAEKSKTVYALGMFGHPITNAIIEQKKKQLGRWYTNDRVKKLKSLVGKGYFGFDCVCLIKGLLWGWNANEHKENGGAVYNSNGVIDGELDCNGMINACSGVSSDFTNIVSGELVYMPGHVGIYIGNGFVIECTPIWKNGVQRSVLQNLYVKDGYNHRKWTMHGKLPFIDYTSETTSQSADNVTVKLPELRKGMYQNSHVEALQILLNGYGFKCDVDGSFGPATEKQVKAFQKSAGLGQDGVVGVKTWPKLLGGNL